MIKLDEKNFKDEVLDSKKPVVVDFWAEWCMPCKMLAPVFEELSKEMKDIKFGKVDVDENRELAENFFIQGIPAIIVFVNGSEKGRIVGMKDKTSLKKEIEAIV